MKLKELARIIDWILYLLLCIIAIYFIIKSDVIQKYLNKNTDSYETTIESDKYVAPDFTFCDHSRRIMKLENQMDLKLSIIGLLRVGRVTGRVGSGKFSRVSKF